MSRKINNINNLVKELGMYTIPHDGIVEINSYEISATNGMRRIKDAVRIFKNITEYLQYDVIATPAHNVKKGKVLLKEFKRKCHATSDDIYRHLRSLHNLSNEQQNAFDLTEDQIIEFCTKYGEYIPHKIDGVLIVQIAGYPFEIVRETDEESKIGFSISIQRWPRSYFSGKDLAYEYGGHYFLIPISTPSDKSN